MSSTIKISKKVKEELDSLKIHHRETYEDVIKRLIEAYRKGEKHA